VTRAAIIDAGPIVAFLARESAEHAWALDQWKLLPAPLLTCDVVLAEAAHLLRRHQIPPDVLTGMIERGVLALAFDLQAEAAAVSRLLKRYRDVPMSLADACLVRMSELIPEATVLTLDSDFLIYRRHGRQPIPTLMPPVM
jgi:predicted nucleic acid-binding protein